MKSLALAAVFAVLGVGSASAEKILTLPTICTNGGCADGGVFFDASSQSKGVVKGKLEYILLQAAWEADVDVYCQESGTTEVVYTFTSGASSGGPVWVKFNGESDLLGYVDGAGNATEVAIYEGEEAAEDAVRKVGPFMASAADLLWTSRALHAAACPLG